jgi:5-methyltetrahydropteroyltriglutamate--homocysteine methyltransferase
MLLPTTIVGSYPQPEWLIDRPTLATRPPPRVRAKELWRIAPEFLEEAQNDATLLAIRAQERAGVDIITDGEMRRESYSNRFATALEGLDIDNPAVVPSRSGKPDLVPRVIGPLRRRHAVEVDDVKFLRANTQKKIKITVPGPFTMAMQAKDFYYGDDAKMAMAYAACVNDEIRDLVDAGADYVQIDEPYMQARAEQARAFGVEALDRALDGIKVPTIIHLCFGYAALVKNKPPGYAFLTELEPSRVAQVSIETAQPNLDLSVLKQMPSKMIVLGVIDLGSEEVETPDVVAQRIERALPHVAAERIIVAPDCGLKYLPRAVAYGKMCAMVEGAKLVRAKLAAAKSG